MPKGLVFLVSTPIGNLDDITLRALQTLRDADLVACEDTRRTGRLLQHFDIDRPLLSCHDHNEAGRAAEIVARAREGASVALVSDAGTPTISDPGYRVVLAALRSEVQVVPIPGPSAPVAALAASGLPPDGFVFRGFLPSKKSKRQQALRAAAADETTAVYFEAPHRILDALRDLRDILGERPVVVAREITKLHEEFLRGTAASILEELEARPTVKGEFVVLVGPKPSDPGSANQPLEARVKQLEGGGRPRMEAIKLAAKERGIPKREAYSRLHKGERPEATGDRGGEGSRD